MIPKPILKWITILGFLLLTTFETSASELQALNTDREKASYAMGVDVASKIKMQGLDVDMTALTQGMKDYFAGGPLLMSDDEIRKAMALTLSEYRRKQQEFRKQQMLNADRTMH